jgi:hypothetical protein
MTGALLDGEFPVGHCARCEKDVLVGVSLDERGEERRRCVHCEAELDPALLRWVSESELDGVGYAAWTEGEHCGRPDCGGGRCGRG